MTRVKQLPPRSKVKPSDTWDLTSLLPSDDAWETMVPEQVAELIQRRGFFGYVKPGARD